MANKNYKAYIKSLRNSTFKKWAEVIVEEEIKPIPKRKAPGIKRFTETKIIDDIEPPSDALIKEISEEE